MSSHCLWWVQPSQTRILSPSSNLSSICAPSTWSFRFPLYLESRMEKEVSGISSGVSADTLANAWLSVMTRRGFLPRDESVSFNSVSRVTIEIAPASSTSRMVCCCGRIRRPFGAAESIGTTRTTKSFGFKRSRTRYLSWSSSGAWLAISSFNSWTWYPVTVLTSILLEASIWKEASDIESRFGQTAPFSAEEQRSDLFFTTT